jgi:hypothetical protein
MIFYTNKLNRTNLIFLCLSLLVYCFLTFICRNNGFFWDNIQLTSIEAHWYYLTDFKTLIVPKYAPEYGISGTGAPPFLALLTASLWKFISYKLWVSHLFLFLWSLLLIYNGWKFIQYLFPEKYVGWVVFIILMETSVLTQFSIASPDFILFTALIISLRGILERKSILLFIGLFFLFTISTRGVLTGSVLFIVHSYFYFSEKQYRNGNFVKTFWPYFPSFLVLSAYIIFYIITQGWFYNNSKFSQAQSLPSDMFFIIKHLCDFGMRLIENGRIIIWLLAFYITFKFYKSKSVLTSDLKFIFIFLVLLIGLYLIFVAFTKMPFLTRYFMPHILLLTLLTMAGVFEYFSERKIKLILILILCFELTGHFWIYPEKITKIWDSTLAHLPFYELRKECFDYIDANKIDYKDISGGFCLYDDRRFVELNNANKIVGRDKNRLYFIYSNISNVPDEWVDEFKNPTYWVPIKSFKNGFVFIIIYKNLKLANQ